jgi:hypothetical protein
MGGCGQPASDKAGGAAAGEAKSPLPPFVAGTWQQRGGVWRMTIEPNGIVSSALIPLGEVTVRPHQTTEMKMIDGKSVSTFTGGDMFAEYNPANRELFVFIEVKEFHVRVFDVRTGGNTVSRFTGPVSGDGSVWSPDWIEIFDYGPKLPMDVNAIEPSLCIFDKVEEKQPTQEMQNKPKGRNDSDFSHIP